MSVELETWYTTEFGDYVIRPTRFMFASYDREGKPLVFGATPEAVAACTPLHLEAYSPGYDGRYDNVLGSAIVGGKL